MGRCLKCGIDPAEVTSGKCNCPVTIIYNQGSTIPAYCIYGLGLCNFGGYSCGKGFFSAIECIESLRK